MTYTLAEAAAAVGLDKSTVRRAVRSGRISGTRDDVGVWHIEACELHRVFPAVPVEYDRADPAAAHRNGMGDALVAELRAVIADLRADRDEWREQAKRLALAAPSAIVTPAPSPTATGGRLGRAWRWLRQAP